MSTSVLDRLHRLACDEGLFISVAPWPEGGWVAYRAWEPRELRPFLGETPEAAVAAALRATTERTSDPVSLTHDVTNLKPTHPQASALSTVTSGILRYAVGIILSIGLQLLRLDPLLIQREKDWEAGQGDAILDIGEIAHGFQVGKVKNTGIAISLIRH